MKKYKENKQWVFGTGDTIQFVEYGDSQTPIMGVEKTSNYYYPLFYDSEYEPQHETFAIHQKESI